jgi:hypothetical protein
VGYDSFALREVEVVECASITKPHACSLITAWKIVPVALLDRSMVRAESQRPALVVKQAAAVSDELRLAARFAAN